MEATASPEAEENSLRCRLCLAEEEQVEEFISLFCRCDSQDRLIVDMVGDLLRLRPPQQNDRLPQHICRQCLVRLDETCGLRKQIVDMDRNFRGKQGGSQESCRICSEEEVDELISVFCVSDGENKLLADMMKELAGVARASEGDGLPQSICGECFGKLSLACGFVSEMMKSDLAVRKTLGKIEVVQESGDYEMAQDDWMAGKRLRTSQKQTPEEPDPFIYLDDPEVEAERLMPLFFTTEEAEFYEQLIFFGVICCCGKLLEDDGELSEHLKVVHVTKETHWSNNKCKDCSKRFQYAVDLQEHMENREKKLFYRCKICNIFTKERRNLQLHFEFTRFHPILDASEEERLSFEEKVETLCEPSGSCCGCYEEFQDGAALLKHTTELHYQERDEHPLFQCMICYNSFSEKQFLLKHQLAYAGTTNYLCREEGCEYRTDQRPLIKKHIEAGLHFNTDMLPEPEPEPEIKEFFCCFSGCNDIFETRDTFEQHCLEHHAEQRIRNQNFSEEAKGANVCPMCCRHFPKDNVYEQHLRSQIERKFVCSLCSRKFMTRDYLTKHEKNHVQQKQQFPCPDCNVSYTNKYNLDRHIRRVHEGLLPELCNTCGKRFSDKNSLKQHIANNHMANRPYKCTACPRTFGSKVLLQKHSLTHSNERPHKCSFCDNCYRHVSDVKRHENTAHLNVKPFICEICESSFVRDRELRLHMTRHTKVKLFPCPVTDCKFSTNIGKKLDVHMHEKHQD